MLQSMMKRLTVFISAQQNVFCLHRIYNYCSHKQVDFFSYFSGNTGKFKTPIYGRNKK